MRFRNAIALVFSPTEGHVAVNREVEVVGNRDNVRRMGAGKQQKMRLGEERTAMRC